MGKKQLTPEEQVTRWEHIRAIENLVGKMTYYGIHCWDEKIWDEMWAKKAEDITLGFNNGYYKGAEAIEGFYQASGELMRLRTEVVKAANPDKFEGKSVEEIFGAGSLDVNNFTTPIVELAEDMKTAKGSGTSCGATPTTTKPELPPIISGAGWASTSSMRTAPGRSGTW